MEVIVYFLGAGLIVATIFLLLDTQQSRRLNKIVKETKNVEPLFLLRAAEQKLITLNNILYGTHARNGVVSAVNIKGDKRQLLSAQLSTLVNEHRNGRITLKAYASQLNELLKKAREVR